jgi:hypothetical protein
MDQCRRALDTGLRYQGFTLDTAPACASVHLPAPPCDICGGPVESEKLNHMASERGGLWACKTCIDGTLGMLFGPGAEAKALASRVLAAAARNRP